MCRDEDAFGAVDAHGDSGSLISQSSLSTDVLPALATCLAHAAEMSAVDLGHLGVEPEELTSGSADDTDGRAVFLACLLYASVHSAQRGDFIARIMALEQAVQQELMGSIQTITQALADAAGSDDDEEDHLESEDVATVSQLKAQIRDLSLRNVRDCVRHVGNDALFPFPL